MDTKIENELNRLGNEVNKYDKTTQSSSNIFTNIYFQKISIPFIVLLVVFIVVKPSFICDRNETTNVKQINIEKTIMYMIIILSIVYATLFYKNIPYINSIISKNF